MNSRDPLDLRHERLHRAPGEPCPTCGHEAAPDPVKAPMRRLIAALDQALTP